MAEDAKTPNFGDTIEVLSWSFSASGPGESPTFSAVFELDDGTEFEFIDLTAPGIMVALAYQVAAGNSIDPDGTEFTIFSPTTEPYEEDTGQPLYDVLVFFDVNGTEFQETGENLTPSALFSFAESLAPPGDDILL